MNRSRKTEIIIASVVVLIAAFVIGRVGFSSNVDGGIQVNNNQELTYYLNIGYDGINVDGKNENLSSGYINVEEVLPEELEFISFITDDIRAINNSTKQTCSGAVIGGKDGLRYEESTNKIAFIVSDLEANCTLKVGIKVKVNTEQSAADIYTLATAQKNEQIAISNENRFYIGNKDATHFEAKITFTGDVPNGLEAYENVRDYITNTKVKLNYINANGYRITKFKTADVVIENGVFTMPQKSVSIEATLERQIGNNVNYRITGKKPIGYQEPLSKLYNENDTVYLDKLKRGDVISGYKFLGWNTEDATLDKDKFLMPANEVTLIGEFEEQKYAVCYQTSPTNEEQQTCFNYRPGETVKLIENQNQGNYLFLGWNKEDNFQMPAEDIVITSNWQRVNGFFTPELQFASIEEHPDKVLSFFNIGDEYNTGVKIKNKESFAIKDVILKVEGTNAIIKEGSEFSICNDTGCKEANITYLKENYIRIDEIPAYSYFIANKNAIHTEFNEENAGTKAEIAISLIGAIADNDYFLQSTQTINETFNVKAKVTICNNVSATDKTYIFQYHITAKETEEANGSEFDTWITLENNSCKSIYLASGDYQVSEVIPQTWTLNEVTGSINKNDSYFRVELNKSYSIDFFNTYNKKGYYHSSGRVSSKISGQG